MKAIVIAGPTACGKSELGIKIASHLETEIISADSRQVFRGLDIGTGKIEGKVMPSFSIEAFSGERSYTLNPYVSEGICHWLIDVVEPVEEFSVADFQRLALKVMSHLSLKGKVPLIVGGTGLYIRALTDGLHFPEFKVSDEVKNRIASMSYGEMLSLLLSKESAAADFIDVKNPRRVARALELLLSGMKSISDMRSQKDTGYEYLSIGVTFEREILCSRIEKRLDERLAAGMVDEVALLIKRGVSVARLDALGLEYRYISRFLSGLMSYEDMRSKLFTEICRFAKRQMTWFKKYSDIKWVSTEKDALELIKSFLA